MQGKEKPPIVICFRAWRGPGKTAVRVQEAAREEQHGQDDGFPERRMVRGDDERPVFLRDPLGVNDTDASREPEE